MTDEQPVAEHTAEEIPAEVKEVLTAPRRIDYVPLDSLKADPRNPKSHDLALIDQSYDRFGVVDVVTVDGRTGYIISGHGRTTALRDAFARGDAAPEGVIVAADGSGWLVPVNTGWASKNDAEASAALIAMNRVTEMGGWVDESLLALLDEISNSGAGFEGVGYDQSDLDDLQAYLDTEHMATNFDPADHEDDDGSDLGAPVELFVDTVVVNVVLKEKDRPALYELLRAQPWVLDIRDSKGR